MSHLHLGHRSERAVVTMMRSAHMIVPKEEIDAKYKECNCQIGIHRVAPPNVSCRAAKYNGEVAAVDICYPFLDGHSDLKVGNHRRRLLVKFSFLGTVPGGLVLGTSLNDWARPLGAPGEILLGNGWPVCQNRAWGSLRNFRLEVGDGSARHSVENGLAGRAARPLKVDVVNISPTESRTKIERRTPTLAVVSKKHLPRSIAGIPSSLAMLARCDILPVYARTAFNRNPESAGPVIHQMHSVRNITHARNDVIHADADRAIKHASAELQKIASNRFARW